MSNSSLNRSDCIRENRDFTRERETEQESEGVRECGTLHSHHVKFLDSMN